MFPSEYSVKIVGFIIKIKKFDKTYAKSEKLSPLVREISWKNHTVDVIVFIY